MEGLTGLLLDSVLFLVGAAVVLRTLLSALNTFVVPRALPDQLTRLIFQASRRVFDALAALRRDYAGKDAVLAFYAPVTLVALPALYLMLVQFGFSAIFIALHAGPVYEAFLLSGSSLLTLGFAQVSTIPQTIASFTEATIGLILIATLIAYLPTMYSAFANREKVVAMLEVRAGSPPTAITMLMRYTRLDRLDVLDNEWETWEGWFTELQESHTSLAALVFFRSALPGQSWINTAGAVLDAAALRLALLDRPFDVRAAMALRAGFITLRYIADFFRFEYNHNPAPDDPISITREEFDAVCEVLAGQAVPLKADRDQAWRDFAGWRVNYDTVLLALKRLTVAPPAPFTHYDPVPGSARR